MSSMSISQRYRLLVVWLLLFLSGTIFYPLSRCFSLYLEKRGRSPGVNQPVVLVGPKVSQPVDNDILRKKNRGFKGCERGVGEWGGRNRLKNYEKSFDLSNSVKNKNKRWSMKALIQREHSSSEPRHVRHHNYRTGMLELAGSYRPQTTAIMLLPFWTRTWPCSLSRKTQSARPRWTVGVSCSVARWGPGAWTAGRR